MAPCNELNLNPQEPVPLFLLVRVDDSEHTFELPANDDRVVVVGSAQSAEVRLEQPGIAPIQFYFERLENDICIVPAYCVSELRVNTARVTTPHRLGRRSIIEFGKTRVKVEVSHSPQFNQSPTAQSHSVGQVVSCVAYLAQLPDGKATTRQPWMDEDHGTNADIASQTLGIEAPGRDNHQDLGPNNRIEGVTNKEYPSLAKTIRKPEYASGVALVSVNVPSSGKFVYSANADESGVVGTSQLEPLNKTLLGLAPPSPSTDKPITRKPKGNDSRSAGTLGLAIPNQLATVLDFPAVDRLIRRKKSWLVRLGLLAKRYPIRVILAAITIALAGSGSVVITTKVFLLRRAPKGISTMPSGLTRSTPAIRSLGVPRRDAEPRDQLQGPSIIVVSPLSNGGNLSPSAVSSANHTAVPTDYAGAILSLVQGRYVEAQVSYASLAKHSSADSTNAVLSRLLTRRLSLGCVNANSVGPKLSCPEIKP